MIDSEKAASFAETWWPENDKKILPDKDYFTAWNVMSEEQKNKASNARKDLRERTKTDFAAQGILNKNDLKEWYIKHSNDDISQASPSMEPYGENNLLNILRVEKIEQSLHPERYIEKPADVKQNKNTNTAKKYIRIQTSFSFGSKKNNTFKTFTSEAVYSIDDNNILHLYDPDSLYKKDVNYKHPGHASQLSGFTVNDISTSENYTKSLFRKSFGDETVHDKYCEEARASIQSTVDCTEEIIKKNSDSIKKRSKQHSAEINSDTLDSFVESQKGQFDLDVTDQDRLDALSSIISIYKQYSKDSTKTHFNNNNILKDRNVVTFLMPVFSDIDKSKDKDIHSVVLKHLDTDKYDDILAIKKLASNADFFSKTLATDDRNVSLKSLEKIFQGYRNQPSKVRKSSYMTDIFRLSGKPFSKEEKEILSSVFQQMDRSDVTLSDIEKTIGDYITDDPDRLSTVEKLVGKNKKKVVASSYEIENAREAASLIDKGIYPLMKPNSNIPYCADPFSHQAFRGPNQMALQCRNAKEGSDTVYFSNLENIRNISLKRDSAGNIIKISVKQHGNSFSDVKGKVLFAGCDERGNREYKFSVLPKYKTVYPVKDIDPSLADNKKQPPIQGIEPMDHSNLDTSQMDVSQMFAAETENYFRSMYSKTPYNPLIKWNDHKTAETYSKWIIDNPQKFFQTMVQANMKLVHEAGNNRTVSLAKTEELEHVNIQENSRSRSR